LGFGSLQSYKIMVRDAGIEPAAPAWKASILTVILIPLAFYPCYYITSVCLILYTRNYSYE
jgi:hypothetical protein